MKCCLLLCLSEAVKQHLLCREEGLLVDAGHNDGVHVHLLPHLLIIRYIQINTIHPLQQQKTETVIIRNPIRI